MLCDCLRTFECVARMKSFTLAAEELNVTRAAVSHQIKNLEDILGFKLFNRKKQSIELTEAAIVALPIMQQGLQNLSQAVSSMKEIGSPSEQMLRVSAAPSFTSKWLVPRLNSFAEQHPEINLDIQSSEDLVDADKKNSPIIGDLLRSRSLDVIVHFGSGSYPNCEVKKLLSVDAVPLCSPSLLKDKSKPLVTPEDLANHTLLHDNTNYVGRPDWSKWFELVGVEGINTNRGIQFNHVSLAMNAAVNGQGVLLSMRTLAERDIENNTLCVPFEQSLPLDIAYYVITNTEQTTKQKAVEAFVNWIREEANNAS